MGQPVAPNVLPPAKETFASLERGSDKDLWGFADLGAVFTYLRGGKLLQIPSEWTLLVPRTL